MPRTVWPAAFIMLAVGISGCDGAGDVGAEPTPAATAQTTASPDGATSTDAVAWAGGVCSAADGLEQSLDALGTSLDVDLGSAAELVDQLGPQVQAQVDVVRDEVQAVTSALSAVPEEADPELVAAAEDLQADRQSLEDSVADLRVAAEGLSDASDAATLVQGVAAVAAQLAVVQLDTTTFADNLESTAQQGATSVQAAFVDAPECATR